MRALVHAATVADEIHHACSVLSQRHREVWQAPSAATGDGGVFHLARYPVRA